MTKQAHQAMSSPSSSRVSKEALGKHIQDSALVDDIVAYTLKQPDSSPLVARILEYFSKTIGGNNNHVTNNASTPSQQLPVDTTPLGPAIYTTNPISFLHPVRKKLVWSFYNNHIALHVPTDHDQVIVRAKYSAIHRILAVPFLERATKQTAVILFMRHEDCGSKDAIWAAPFQDDGKDFVITFNDKSEAEDVRGSLSIAPGSAGAKRPDHVLMSLLTHFVRRSELSNQVLSKDTPAEIVLNHPSSPVPNFSAHLKSNQGTIYLLPTGMLFAFKKPLMFFPTAVIEAVGIHSVVSRTFDFEIILTNAASPEEYEGTAEGKDGKRAVVFGMVESKEFGRMEEWIKKSGIRDRSLSEDLKAKDKAVATTKKRERAEGEEEAGDGQDEGSSTKKTKQGEGNGFDDDDDEEDDEDFAPESDDDVAEEYDSGSEADNDAGTGDDESGDDSGEEVGEGGNGSHVDDEDEDMDEESLGDEDSGDDDDDEEEEVVLKRREIDAEDIDELEDDE